RKRCVLRPCPCGLTEARRRSTGAPWDSRKHVTKGPSFRVPHGERRGVYRASVMPHRRSVKNHGSSVPSAERCSRGARLRLSRWKFLCRCTTRVPRASSRGGRSRTLAVLRKFAGGLLPDHLDRLADAVFVGAEAEDRDAQGQLAVERRAR